MKKYLLIGLILGLVGLAVINARQLIMPSACGAACDVKASSESVDPVSFEQVTRNNDAVILDVRTPGEFAQGHIAKASNLDFNNQSVFAKGIESLDRNKTYLIYCRSGNRSAQAQKIMHTKGISTVNLNGGIAAWQSAGLPVEK